MTELATRLENHPVFSALTDSERALVSSLAVQKEFRAGEAVTRHGDVWPYLLLVKGGSIQALKESSEGRSLIVITFLPDDVFWGLAFFEEETPMPVMLRANQASRVWLWRREWLLPVLWANGRFSWELSRLMALRMQRASDILEEMAFQPVRGRLAHMLLDQFPNAVDDFVTRDLTLDEMAARVGTKREMVCRLLYQFAEAGAIEISRTEFMISDRDLLEGIALQSRK